jgi:uncharacterized membrane protein YkoI
MKAKSMLAAVAALFLAGQALAHEEGEHKFKASIDVKAAKESAYPSLAKVSFSQALSTALPELKGEVLEIKAELENENGLIYSIEGKMADGSEIEVNIDAGTGKILEVLKESKEDKAKEDKKDAESKKDPKDSDD